MFVTYAQLLFIYSIYLYTLNNLFNVICRLCLFSKSLFVASLIDNRSKTIRQNIKKLINLDIWKNCVHWKLVFVIRLCNLKCKFAPSHSWRKICSAKILVSWKLGILSLQSNAFFTNLKKNKLG